MKFTDSDQIPAQRKTLKRSWRARRRSIIIFILLFCLIPISGLYMSSTSFFEDRIGLGKEPFATISLDDPSNVVVPALPALPAEMAEQEMGPKLSEEDAIAFNNGVPESKDPVVPARPFLVPSNVAMEISRKAAINCLTSAIYYEAAIEAERGQRAVAQVVLNRVRHPAYPNNICGVVFQGSQRSTGCQFSFTCDGSLARTPSPSIWKKAEKLAAEAISGTVEPSVGTATHYHTVWIVPYWAKSLVKVKTVGSHIFYRWSGYWGKRPAFTQKYAGEDLSEDVLTESEGETSPEQAFDLVDQEPSEQPIYVPETDPILTPKFEAGPSTTALPENDGLSADDAQSSIAADNEKGTLILD
ncbi:MAG: cell wall hydrolase [Parasphingorhabdus sp.]|uniref:cell wall hydrolase n=1 Tax=Parasphingorhabdus sp. TaxID=2709688 RepID=UPI0032982D88